ncbi:MAG: hypothetical protein PHF86_10585 [Candidatus Nanoarchaeia archaeon]|nr:hypothetical protein [Candidatus Nanoarchaeia archaeon]
MTTTQITNPNAGSVGFSATETLYDNNYLGIHPTYYITTNTGLKAELTKEINGEKGISPKLYFSYVKSKLTKTDQKKFKIRMGRLQSLLQEASELGQDALYEHTAKLLAIVIRESEACACGITESLERETIDKFINIVKGARVSLKKLEEFPRLIPANIGNKIKKIKEKGLFDEYWILYTEAPNAEKIETNEKKINRKDPIIFGKYSYQPNKFYYIASWIDEYCDITIDKFVETVKTINKEYKLNVIPDMDEFFMESIKKEVKMRHERLENTRRDNYRQLMEEEREEREKRQQKDKPLKISFWKRLFYKKGKK